MMMRKSDAGDDEAGDEDAAAHDDADDDTGDDGARGGGEGGSGHTGWLKVSRRSLYSVLTDHHHPMMNAIFVLPLPSRMQRFFLDHFIVE